MSGTNRQLKSDLIELGTLQRRLVDAIEDTKILIERDSEGKASQQPSQVVSSEAMAGALVKSGQLYKTCVTESDKIMTPSNIDLCQESDDLYDMYTTWEESDRRVLQRYWRLYEVDRRAEEFARRRSQSDFSPREEDALRAIEAQDGVMKLRDPHADFMKTLTRTKALVSQLNHQEHPPESDVKLYEGMKEMLTKYQSLSIELSRTVFDPNKIMYYKEQIRGSNIHISVMDEISDTFEYIVRSVRETYAACSKLKMLRPEHKDHLLKIIEDS